MTRREDLLPGVTSDECPPRVVVNSRDTVIRARRVAILRDLANVCILAGVDYVFLSWPSTHIPTLDRDASMLFVAALNGVVVAHIAMSRLAPRWAAKRIATTWNLRERSRFFQG
jgi:hypothetical protein